MKKLLILNGSHSDIPLIQAGKKLGYYVITSGNNPDLIGHQYADEYVCADYSDYKLIEKIAREKEIDAICACANDFGAITASYVAEKLGLPGHDSFETTLTLHHKDKFKEFSKANKLRTPEAEGFDNEAAAVEYAMGLDYPVMIKPIDLTGGKGITKAFTPEEKRAAIQKAMSMSPSKRIVIERFIQGTYHSFSTYLVDQKVTYCFSDNEYFSGDPLCCILSAGPADRIDQVEHILIEECEKLARLLNLVDGRLHVQYVMAEDGTPYALEYTRRCSGDVYSYPVMRALGLNTPEWIVKAECGISVKDCPKNVPQRGFVGRHCLLGPRNGKVKNVTLAPELQKYVYDQILCWTPGTEITYHQAQRLGVIFFDFPTRELMLDTVARISELVTVEYED